MKRESDPINPDHYRQDNEIECIDAMLAAYGEEEVRIYAKLAALSAPLTNGD